MDATACVSTEVRMQRCTACVNALNTSYTRRATGQSTELVGRQTACHAWRIWPTREAMDKGCGGTRHAAVLQWERQAASLSERVVPLAGGKQRRWRRRTTQRTPWSAQRCCEPMPCTSPHDCPHQRRRSWSMGGVASPEQVADSRNAKPVRMHQFGPRDARRGRSCSTVNVCREVCHAASRVVRKGAVGVAAIETRRTA